MFDCRRVWWNSARPNLVNIGRITIRNPWCCLILADTNAGYHGLTSCLSFPKSHVRWFGGFLGVHPNHPNPFMVHPNHPNNKFIMDFPLQTVNHPTIFGTSICSAGGSRRPGNMDRGLCQGRSGIFAAQKKGWNNVTNQKLSFNHPTKMWFNHQNLAFHETCFDHISWVLITIYHHLCGWNSQKILGDPVLGFLAVFFCAIWVDSVWWSNLKLVV